MLDERKPGIFEPDAEEISPEALAVLQRDRLRALIDRLIAVGGVQGGRRGKRALPAVMT